MFCPTCGTAIPDGTKFCSQCGHALTATQSPITTPASTPGIAPPQLSSSRPSALPRIGLMLAVGFLVGGLIGFSMRPSVLLIGQLPFGTVLTRGSALSGLDQLLIPTAQQSFNVMVLGALIGSAGGFGLIRLVAKGGA